MSLIAPDLGDAVHPDGTLKDASYGVMMQMTLFLFLWTVSLARVQPPLVGLHQP